jgi:hypothetical protein
LLALLRLHKALGHPIHKSVVVGHLGG